MHWIALMTPMPAKPIALVAILTIYHNLQYHRLIWFHNQKYKRYAGVPPASSARDARVPSIQFGPASLISRRLLYYIAFGIIFGVIYQGPRQYLGYLNLHTGDSPAALTTPIQLGIAFLWGYAFVCLNWSAEISYPDYPGSRRNLRRPRRIFPDIQSVAGARNCETRSGARRESHRVNASLR